MQNLQLREHLVELRNRCMIVALFVVIGCVLALVFQTEVIAALLKPMEGESLIYTSPYGGFEFIFKVILFLGLIFAIPAALYQTFQFIAPALPKKIDGLGSKIIIISSILAMVGVGFAYFIAIPASLRFLNSIGGDFLESFISTNEYLSFFMVYLLGFAIIFQLPLVMSIIDKNHPLQPKSLLKKQKYIIAGSYLVAALMTPTPDAMNQTIMALPIVLLYQVGIGVIWTQRKGEATDELTVQETNWYSQTPEQNAAQQNGVIDLNEEKQRYARARTKRRPRMVTDMVAVPAQGARQAQAKTAVRASTTTQPARRQTATAKKRRPQQTTVKAPKQGIAVVADQAPQIKPTKLPLSIDQHMTKIQSKKRPAKLQPAAQPERHHPQQRSSRIATTTSKKSVSKISNTSKSRMVQRPTYMNAVIKNRSQQVLLQG